MLVSGGPTTTAGHTNPSGRQLTAQQFERR